MKKRGFMFDGKKKKVKATRYKCTNFQLSILSLQCYNTSHLNVSRNTTAPHSTAVSI
mgnify:CR=1 FL=1